MKHLVLFFITSSLFSCTISDIETLESEPKESCDFAICEDGREAVDTLIDVYGVVKKKDEFYYVEVTGYAPEPDTLFITCMSDGLIFPEEGSYVKCGGIIKEPCGEEVHTSKDSFLLQNVELLNPIAQGNCDNEILSEGYDNNEIDEKLSIHHLSVVDSCLNILISYVGNCNQLPELTLHNSTDILLGDGILINVNLQGKIQNDCDVQNYVVLKFDISPLWDTFDRPATTHITLYFQSQGYLRIG